VDVDGFQEVMVLECPKSVIIGYYFPLIIFINILSDVKFP
jgi:hypothetical protein